jgi:homoserine O-succinyltransferase
MPINIPNNLPAITILKNENIFIMDQQRASHQDIRPLRIAFCNLMPLKIVTETDFIRVLSNTPLQIELDFFYMDKHDSKNTAKQHLNIFYKTFDQIKHNRYDGLIITGAPVENLRFEEVDYWNDISEVMEWSKTNVTNTLQDFIIITEFKNIRWKKNYSEYLNTRSQIIKYRYSGVLMIHS